MAKIENLSDFKNITSNITSFSHAYLFKVNSLKLAYPYIKEFAKMIILEDNYESTLPEYKDISYKIDNDEFDDLYIVNPDTIGINTSEISKLLEYMETKSIRNNGRRVYIINGIERMTRDVSNKILKFLEEPSDNIYALLVTENYEKNLSTIISRCQVLSFNFVCEEKKDDKLINVKDFISNLIECKYNMIAYEYKYLQNELTNRAEFYDFFELLEKMFSENLNKKYNCSYNDLYICSCLENYSVEDIIKMLNITNNLKCLVKGNINLNLLVDRYIIEITEVL